MPEITSKHSQALAWAKASIGQHEDPLGSNTGAFVITCQRASWVPGTRWPWCVAFWLRAWEVAGYKVLPYKGAGAYATLDWYRKNLPAWVVGLEQAKPGAAVIFNIGSGHLAMLAKPVRPSDKTVTTVGGNESDAVRQTVRDRTLVRGVVDPFEAETPKPARPPLYEVVTSESGEAKVVYVSGQKAVSRKLGQILNRFGGVTIRRRKD